MDEAGKRLFEELVRQIEAAYAEFEHSLGWRFITSPKRTLSPDTEIVFLTMNPAGKRDRPDHPAASSEAGSAYVVESWEDGTKHGQSKLQVQVQAMFRHLNVQPDEVLSGQLVPFRSPSWDELSRKKESLALGTSVWRRVLQYVEPRLLILMGKTVLRPAAHEILGHPRDTEHIDVNWGNITGTREICGLTTVVSLPHLSRFGIMTRSISEPAVRSLLGVN